MIDKGILYIATGDKYLQEAIISANSVKLCSKDISVALITDSLYFENKVFDNIIYEPVKIFENEDTWKSHLLYKIKCFTLSPFKKTLFLDSDTYVIGNIKELFEILVYFDLLVTKDMSDNSEITINGKKLKNYTPYNTGVVGYVNCDRVCKFLDDWYFLYKENFIQYWSDQPAFMHSLALNVIKSYCLHSNYNFRFLSNVGFLDGSEVKIIHGRASKEEFDHIAKEVNKTKIQRAWIASLRRQFNWENRLLKDKIRIFFK